MIDYVIKNNIDKRVIEKASNILKKGGIIACPTDTNWSIFADIDSKEAIEKLKQLKGGINTFTFTLVCSSLSEIHNFVEITNSNFRILNRYCPGPFVFILPSLRSAQKKIAMKRSELGVRIPTHPIPLTLVQHHGNPLFAITASKKLANNYWWDFHFAEENLYEFSWELEEITDIDLIIDESSEEPQPKILSTVVSLIEEPKILRQGIGKFES